MLCVRFLSLQVCGGSDGAGVCELRRNGGVFTHFVPRSFNIPAQSAEGKQLSLKQDGNAFFFLSLIQLSPCKHGVSTPATESALLQVWFICHGLTDTY